MTWHDRTGEVWSFDGGPLWLILGVEERTFNGIGHYTRWNIVCIEGDATLYVMTEYDSASLEMKQNKRYA